jgi:hypothetical protein
VIVACLGNTAQSEKFLPREIMMRSCFLAMCLLAALAPNAVALDGTLAIPQLNKPASAATEGDALHAKYEAAWTRYEEAVAKATDGMNKALDELFNKAADGGDLDLADMWDKKKKLFSETKTLEWPTDVKAKADWRKANPRTEFPKEFSEVVLSTHKAYAAAVNALEMDYEELVKEYTKARNLERAKQVREEMAALDSESVVPPIRPRRMEEKPNSDKKSTSPRSGVELQRAVVGTAWKNQNGFTFEWDASGSLWHCKDGGRSPVKVVYADGTKCFIEFINNGKQILVFKKDLSAFEQYNQEGALVQSAIRLR